MALTCKYFVFSFLIQNDSGMPNMSGKCRARAND